MTNEQKTQHISIFQKLCHNSMTFTPFLPKSSPHTFHRVCSQESSLLLPKGVSNNMIFLFQKCDTFGKTTKGRTWLDSQDHPDFTQLIWSFSFKIHIIDSQKLNYLKNK